MQTAGPNFAQLDRVVRQRPVRPEGPVCGIRDERGSQERGHEDGGPAVQPLPLLAPFGRGPPVPAGVPAAPAGQACSPAPRWRLCSRRRSGCAREFRVPVAVGVHVVVGCGGSPGPMVVATPASSPAVTAAAETRAMARRASPSGAARAGIGHQHGDQGPAEEQHRRSPVALCGAAGSQDGVNVGGVRGGATTGSAAASRSGW
jgi:hypothetical protein